MAYGTDPSQPDYARPEVLVVAPDLELMADLLSGTRQMWRKAATYIRQWTDENSKVFEIRSKCEQLYEGLGRTLSAAVGMLFARQPDLEWNQSETAMTEHWDSIDAAGTAGHVFVKKFAEAAVRDGVGLLLVDHPSPPVDPATNEPVVVTGGNEGALGLRPTWAFYARASVLSWRTETINSRQVLTQLVLSEPTTVPDGGYGVKVACRYRVLRLVRGVAIWGVYEESEERGQKKTYKLIGSGAFRNKAGAAADFLPVAIAHTGRSDEPLVATIPLLGVAWANLGHWQLSSNLRFYADLAAFPQPTVIGELARQPGVDTAGNATLVPGQLRVGPMVVVHLSGENADYKYTAPPVEAFEPLAGLIAQKERQMAQQGMSFLAADHRQQETAEAKRLDATAENATLATAAQGIDDAVNLAFEHHAWYLGIPKAGAPVFTLNRDFESTAMDAATMIAYVSACERAGLPPRLLLEAWQAGGRIPPDTDLDKLLDEMMVNQAAKEEQARLAQERQTAGTAGPAAPAPLAA